MICDITIHFLSLRKSVSQQVGKSYGHIMNKILCTLIKLWKTLIEIPALKYTSSSNYSTSKPMIESFGQLMEAVVSLVQLELRKFFQFSKFPIISYLGRYKVSATVSVLVWCRVSAEYQVSPLAWYRQVLISGKHQTSGQMVLISKHMILTWINPDFSSNVKSTLN